MTGRKPLPAAPSPMPVKADSEIGVMRTRWSPNFCSSAVARRVASVNTRSSRCISSIMASSSAWRKLISRMLVLLLREHVDEQVLGIGVRAGLGEIDGGVQIALHPFAHGLDVG